jgi:hypothetical protein
VDHAQAINLHRLAIGVFVKAGNHVEGSECFERRHNAAAALC